MKAHFLLLIITIGVAAGSVTFYIKKQVLMKEKKQVQSMDGQAMYDKEIYTVEDIQALLDVKVQDLEARALYGKEHLLAGIQALIALPSQERNVQTFIKPLDTLMVQYGRVCTQCSLMTMVHPDALMREKAAAVLQAAQEFFVDHVEMNKALYDAMVDYAQKMMPSEQVTDEVHYFVAEWLLDSKRSGLALPENVREQVTALKKELAHMETVFEMDLAKDTKKLTFSAVELQGVPTDILQGYEKTSDGLYSITLSSSVYTVLMENCALEATRKKIYEAYGTRGYPSNKTLLESIVRKRYELAQLLGYESYVRYDLEKQMVKTPERAQLFLDDLLPKVLRKSSMEVALLKRQLPEGVTLAANGVFKPWDLAYVESCYKKKHYSVDELTIAEYFPLENTIQGLFSIYEAFFGLSMKEMKAPALWNQDLRLLKIEKNDGTCIGHVILDLHPRENKYGHACEMALVAGHHDLDGAVKPGLAVVIANFTKPTEKQPSLLKYDEVVTFFHEFGHALHELLGATYLQSLAGTHVKTDFVELPSQLLELWLEEKIVLKNLSKHYKTGEPIPGALVDSKLEADRLSYGIYLARQIMLSMVSLSLFDKHPSIDTDDLWKAMHAKMMSGITEYCPHVHQQASFGHLASSGYASKYYGYLWACVIGNDIFDKIKRDGLLDPAVGRAYSAAILAPGGSKDPNVCIQTFLDREPRQDAFLKRYGLE